MSSTILPTTSTSVQSIVKQFDTNNDGQFSVDEFTEFLNAFMKSVTGQATSTGTTTNTASNVGTTSLLATTTAATNRSRLNDPLPQCPLGWNEEKWVNPEKTSIKYVAGRIMARYSPSDWVDESKREQILADFKTAGLNPTASGKDKCDFGDGIGPIDIVYAAGEGGKAWQWLPVNG
jgi:hypothetical protein